MSANESATPVESNPVTLSAGAESQEASSAAVAAVQQEENVDDEVPTKDEDGNDDEDSAESATAAVAPPSINDEEAFPALGGSAGSAVSTASTPISWGPSMLTSTAPSTASSSNGSKPASAPAATSKPKSIVELSNNSSEAFNIEHTAALNIPRTELSKIVSELKKTYQVSIESTLSSVTKNRSFVVSGNTNNVRKVRQELVRRLTKPVKLTFQIPAKTRSSVIGASGKNLKPILEATSTKIDIERNTTPTPGSIDDDEEATITVTIDGDHHGAEEAKSRILAIVNEEIKTLTTKINIPENLTPFAKGFESDSEDLTITGPNKSNVLFISGLREKVLAKKAEISLQLESLATQIKVEPKKIPKRVHQFINASDILKKHQVVVKFSNDEQDETVTFTGLPSNISKAIETARFTTSQYVVTSLDISKAHGGKLDHARALAAFFQHSGILKQIGEANNARISAPSYAQLGFKDLQSVELTFNAPKDTSEGLSQARKEVIEKVNNFGPNRVRFINDILSFFSKRILSATESAAKAENVYVIPLSQLSNGVTDEIILIALDQSDDEFAPSQEEIDERLQKVDKSLDELRSAQADLKKTVLNVPSDKQQFIEGPKGTTLKNLLSSVDHIIIKLHNDGEQEAADKVFLMGSKTNVSKLEKEIDALLKDAADLKDLDSYSIESKVPTSVLARLIGKNGANLNSLKDQYEVNVDVEKNPTGEKASLTITGYKYNVKEAEQFIQQSSKRWADEVTKTLIVPQKFRSSMIGANGQHVKKLQTKYNVKINFSQSTDEVQIRGPSRGAVKAQEELKDLLDFEIENGYTKEITVPQKAISRLIGRQGDTINRIALDSGIDINIEHQGEAKDSETRTITLTGARKGLNEAEKKISAIVKEVQDTVSIELDVDPKYFKDILGPRGSVKQNIIDEACGNSEEKDYRRLLHIPDQGSESNKIVSTGSRSVVEKIVAQVKKIVEERENSITETLEVPKEKHRYLIGPSGSVRRSIEEEFKVQLNIPKTDSKSTSVSINGLQDNVTKAKVKVEELTADAWRVEISVPAYLHSAVSERGAFTRRVRNHNNVEIEHGDSTKKAFKLSGAFPTPPKDAFGTGDDIVKFTIVEGDVDGIKKDENDVIPWRLKGDEAEVAKVEKQIKEALTKFSKDDSSAFFWVKDTSVLGKIVGPQGSRLNNIRKKSGSQIYVPRSTDKVNNVIYLKGTKESLEKADKLLRSEISK